MLIMLICRLTPAHSAGTCSQQPFTGIHHRASPPILACFLINKFRRSRINERRMAVHVNVFPVTLDHSVSLDNPNEL